MSLPFIEQIYCDLIPIPSRHSPVNDESVSSLAKLRQVLSQVVTIPGRPNSGAELTVARGEHLDRWVIVIGQLAVSPYKGGLLLILRHDGAISTRDCSRSRNNLSWTNIAPKPGDMFAHSRELPA